MSRCLWLCILCFCCIVSLGACQVSKKRLSGSGVTCPDKRLGTLLNQGEMDKAVAIVMGEKEFFASSYGDPTVRAVLDRFARDLAVAYAPFFADIKARTAAITWPAPQSKWSKIRNTLAGLRAELDEFRQTAPFQYAIYLPDAYGVAFAAVKDKERQIRDEAQALFAEYDLTAKESFFDVYPVSVDRGLVIKRNEAVWSAALKGFSQPESDVFFSIYGTYLPQSAKEVSAKKFFDTLCPNPKTASLKTILEAYRKCEAAGLRLKEIPSLKVAFLQVTSPDLIKDKELDFPLSVKVDVPFNASKASMRKMFSHKAVKEADIVILVNVALSKAVRVVEREEKVYSMFIESYTQIENPEYAIVKTELASAAEQYHKAQSSNSYTWGASIIEKFIVQDEKDGRVRDTKGRLDALKHKLKQTEKFSTVPNYQPYQVTKAHMDIYKNATVNYYIIDKRQKRFFRDTFDYSEKSFFTVCYALHDLDRDKDRLLQTSVLEEDVVRHELEPVTVRLSDLLEQYVSTPSSWKRYADMAPIHRAVTSDVTRAQKNFDAQNYRYDKYHDQRFDSVVVVRNIGTNIGTGFYVREDLIVTNYHVVQESEYVRLKMFNEREMMGRVIARDARLDLALVQADVKGRPVCFYDKLKIPLGTAVEAIGHPNGLQFSITRGVISSVREERSVNYRLAKDWVLFIQTDAAVNGGNSGGPLFYGDYVVGVNNWGYMTSRNGVKNVNGLNFAIHYSEIFKFLERNGIEVCKGSKS